MAAGHDPWRDHNPELALTMAATVKERIAFGERAGEKMQRMVLNALFKPRADVDQPVIDPPRDADVQCEVLYNQASSGEGIFDGYLVLDHQGQANGFVPLAKVEAL